MIVVSQNKNFTIDSNDFNLFLAKPNGNDHILDDESENEKLQNIDIIAESIDKQSRLVMATYSTEGKALHELIQYNLFKKVNKLDDSKENGYFHFIFSSEDDTDIQKESRPDELCYIVVPHPSNCLSCRFEHDQICTASTHRKMISKDIQCLRNKPDWCPLSELPAKDDDCCTDSYYLGRRDGRNKLIEDLIFNQK